MSWGQTLLRAAVSAAVGTGLAIAVNLATSGDYSVWVWCAVVGLTVAVVAVSLWNQHNQPTPAPTSASGIEFGNVKARRFRAKNVKSSGTALRIGRGRFREDIDIADIEAGHGDASHP